MEQQELWSAIAAALLKSGKTVTFMESCTGGGLANALTDIPGASAVFRGSFVTYSNEAKTALGVPEEIIDTFGIYSRETSKAMAETALSKTGADFAIGVTGQLGRKDPENPDGTVNEVFFAIAKKGGDTVIRDLSVMNMPRPLQKAAVIEVIGMLFKRILCS